MSESERMVRIQRLVRIQQVVGINCMARIQQVVGINCMARIQQALNLITNVSSRGINHAVYQLKNKQRAESQETPLVAIRDRGSVHTYQKVYTH
jgi:hypothetical protein